MDTDEPIDLDGDRDALERHIQVSVAAARVTYRGAVAAGRAHDAAYNSAREALVDVLGPEIEVQDLDGLLSAALEDGEVSLSERG